MSTYSQRNAPVPRTLGGDIPAGVRRAITSWFTERNVRPADVMGRYFRRMGYADVADVRDDVRYRWGDEAASDLNAQLQSDRYVDQFDSGDARRKAATEIVPFYMPTALYLGSAEVQPRGPRRLPARNSALFVEAAVGLGIAARDEEAGHRVLAAWVAAGGKQALEATQVGLDHLAVQREREDQGDVDRAAAGVHVFDSTGAG